MTWLEWQFLLFLVPIALGVLYVLLMLMGGVGAGHGEADGGDADAGAGELATVDADAGVDLHADAGHFDLHDAAHPGAAGAQTHAAGAGGFVSVAAGFLGFGRVPLSILIMCYCFVWGLVGMATLTLAGPARISLAIALALAASILATRQIALLLSRLLPSYESYYTPPRALLGLHGQVLYEVTASSGVVRLRDERQNLRDMPARVYPGQAPIRAGERVALLRYDAAARTFLVAPVGAEPGMVAPAGEVRSLE